MNDLGLTYPQIAALVFVAATLGALWEWINRQPPPPAIATAAETRDRATAAQVRAYDEDRANRYAYDDDDRTA